MILFLTHNKVSSSQPVIDHIAVSHQFFTATLSIAQEQLDSMVAEIKTSAAADEYLESFEHTIRHDMLMIGSISAEQVELHEKALKEHKIKQQQLEVC